MMAMKTLMKPSLSRLIDVRGLRYHVREWGRPGMRPLFMLHGWADVSATFQFLVDALQGDWHVIAPDWRGFGHSGRSTGREGADAYWFPDYLADLDALLSHYSPDRPVPLLGHSMGGNIASLYAGIRPSRVSAVAMLDAFGLPEPAPDEAAGRYEKWLAQLRSPQGFRSFPSVEAFAERLRRDNARLDEAQALFLATHLGESDGAGGVRAAVDAAHRNVNPILYRRAEAESCWRRVTAPVLWVAQADPAWRHALGVDDEAYRAVMACFGKLTELAMADSGHNLHHDQPERLARAIEDFLQP